MAGGDRWKAMEEFQNRCLDQVGNYLNVNWELQYSPDCLEDIDARDLLPSDPFDMESTATRFGAIWIGEIDKDSGSSSFGSGKDDKSEEGKKRWDERVFTGMNFVLKGSVRIYPEPGDNATVENKVASTTSKDSVDGKIDESMSFSHKAEEVEDSEMDCVYDEKGAPHDGLFYALSYLGVRDLLLVQQVCKSLCDTVRNDPLLWRNIHIDQPLNTRITDDSLLQLTNRAQGNLKCLSIVSCPKITNSGIERVLQSNPGMTKLGVPGCGKMNMDGMISKLKALKSAGLLRIKHLRVGGIFGVTHEHFEEMKSLLALDNEHMQQLNARKPRFYHYGQLHLSFDDDRAIDLETCPRCQEPREVYDCPAESCQSKKHTCRGCICCISRCIICGSCLFEREHVESFLLDFRCFDCLNRIMREIHLYISV